MNARAVERMTVESELRAPSPPASSSCTTSRSCAEDRSLPGMEALVRWRHPRLGLLAPGRFVPLAEDCGLIWELGLAVMELAVAQLAAWDRAGLEVPRIAVNVSPAQLRPELVERIAEILDRHGVAACRLEIELTRRRSTDRPPTACCRRCAAWAPRSRSTTSAWATHR